MPKSKNKRKSGKKKKSTAAPRPPAAPQAHGSQTLHYDEIPLVVAVQISALVTGSMTATGLTPPALLPFAVATLTIFIARYAGKLIREAKSIAQDARFLPALKETIKSFRTRDLSTSKASSRIAVEVPIVVTAHIALLTTYFFLFGELLPTVLLLLASLTFPWRRANDIYSPRDVLLHVVVVLAAMPTLTILGIHCQVGKLVFEPGILGLVPGTLLAAAIIAKHVSVFETAGWQRLLEKTNRKGETVQRPGTVSQLYSLLLCIGPGLPFVAATLGYLPRSLMLSIAPLFFVSTLARGFSEKIYSDEEVFRRTLHLATLAAVAMLVAGLLSWA